MRKDNNDSNKWPKDKLQKWMGYVKWQNNDVFLKTFFSISISQKLFFLFWAQLRPVGQNWRIKFVRRKIWIKITQLSSCQQLQECNYWNKIFREAVQSQSLEISKARLDKVHNNSPWNQNWLIFEQECGLESFRGEL